MYARVAAWWAMQDVHPASLAPVLQPQPQTGRSEFWTSVANAAAPTPATILNGDVKAIEQGESTNGDVSDRDSDGLPDVWPKVV